MDSILWQGKGFPPDQCTSRDKYTGVQQEHLATRPSQNRPLTSAWVYRIYHHHGWATKQPYSFRSIQKGQIDSLDQMMIYPNGCDPLSPAACPVLVISRLMRPEVTITFLNIQQQITLNVTSPDIRPYKFVQGLNKTEGTNSTTSIWESPQD